MTDEKKTEIYELSIAEAYKKAEAAGYDVLLPADDELFIDLDNTVDASLFDSYITILQHFYEAVQVRRTPSPSGDIGKEHVVIKMGININPEQRILLQACLGSDRKRELLGWIMHDSFKEKTPTLFFEKEST